MAGGRRIDDHSSWLGAKPKGSVFPEGSKMKMMEGVEGAGGLDDYQDTSSKIRNTQEIQDRQIKKYPTKEGYRN